MAGNQTYEVRKSPGKGYCMFALKPIREGTLILQEQPLLWVPNREDDDADEEVMRAFAKLSKADQDQYLALHEGAGYKNKVLRIFHANCFSIDGDEGRSIYTLICRINHSCIANTWHYDGRLIATRSISAGEEITHPYNEVVHECLTAAQRAEMSWWVWGFRCSCVACLPSDSRPISDGRRRLISCLTHALEGYLPPDYGTLGHPKDDDAPVAWPPVRVKRAEPLTLTQRVEYHFLLARLKQAEQLSPYYVMRAWSDAAGSLLEYMNNHFADPRLRDVLPITPSRYIRDWTKIALDMSKQYFPPGDEHIHGMEMNWMNLHKMVWMKALNQGLVSQVCTTLRWDEILENLLMPASQKMSSQSR